jgi:hypothetical protein
MGFLNGLAQTFRDSALSALGAGFEALADPQSFLKDDLPANANPVAKWIQSRNRRACRLHARNEAAGAYSDLGALRRPRFERVCGPYLDSIGEGATAGGSYRPPFTGGQCSILYTGSTSATFRIPDNFTQDPNDFIYITRSTTQTSPPVLGPLSLRVQNGNPSTGVGAQVAFVNSNGTTLASLFVANFNATVVSVNSASVSPVSGLDNCGNLPNEYYPPTYPPNLPSIGPPDTSTPPPGGDGGDDVTVDPDGNIRICENGDCSDPFSPGGGGGDPSEDPGEEDGDPNENDPNDPGDDITGCASEGQILTGIKIEITQIPVGENPGSGGFYRNVCWVWMGPSQDQLDLVTDGRFLESGQFVIPDSNNCRCYRVRPSPLWGLSVQAYSRPEKED